MKKRIIILAVALICVLVLCAGCGSLSAVKEAKAMIDAYYDAFSDEDFDDIADMCHDSLIEDVGSAENLEAALQARYEYYGDVDEYDYTNYSFETSGGQTEVTLTLDVTYESGDTMTEEFIVFKGGNDLSIIGIDLE